MKIKNYDLAVVGSGDAGKEVAYPAARAGWKVAIIDKNPFGGTCGLRGCVPKKILFTGAELADFNRRMRKSGVKIGNSYMRWSQIQRLRKSSTDSTLKANKEGFKKAGIYTYSGNARFISKNTLRIFNTILKAKYFHIAAGSKPMPLNIPGEKYIKTSTDFLALKKLPQKIIFIGGGYISFEFANIAARAGSKAIILHRSSKVLKQFDQDIVKYAVDAAKEIGIKIKLNQPLKRVEKRKNGFAVFVDKNGKEKEYTAEMVFHGAGRVPDIDDLDLQQAGIKRDRKGIIVNEYLQSVSNLKVYAAGDASSTGPPLTPVAIVEGKIVSHNLLNKKKIKRPDYTFVPSVVFTLPPLASVGYTEEKLKETNLKYTVKFKETEGWFHNSRVNEKYAAHKILIEKKTGQILGAHIIGSKAEELINILGLAMQNGLKAQDLKKTIYAYPTASSSIQYMV